MSIGDKVQVRVALSWFPAVVVDTAERFGQTYIKVQGEGGKPEWFAEKPNLVRSAD